MSKVMAVGIGSMIALMIAINAVFAQKIGDIPSIVIINVVGLLAAMVCTSLDSKPKTSEKPPFYFYLSGVIGIFLVFSNSHCFTNLGASLTLTLGLFGRSIGSLLIDSFGLLGMRRQAFRKRKLVGIGVMILGLCVMIEHWRINSGYMALSIVTGVAVILTMVLNTRLAQYKGLFKGTQNNFITGGITAVVAAALLHIDLISSFKKLPELSPIYILGGGLLGVCVVASINYVLPKIPTFHGTILIFLGEISTAVSIDFAISGNLPLPKVIGGAIVLLGLLIDQKIDLLFSNQNKFKSAFQ